MDLGCIDMGCIEKQSKEISPDRQNCSGSTSSDSVMATSKIGKNKAIKESGQSTWNAFSKCTSQIRKPPHRKTSPLNWFPRKKVDSYLKRKIQLLQEVDGMNSTLDETLGDSNLHYSRVLKEKIAVKEAATKAMEARKAAMVEASWCRILKAASIDCSNAEAQLVEAEKVAAEAFEAATAIGVTMYDIPDCPQRSCKIESSATKGGGGSAATHTVSASFETAFEVDKQVAYAVKTAFTKLANCSSIKKDEFRELLRKISENPDSDENFEDLSGIYSECDSDTGSEIEVAFHGDSSDSQSCTHDKEPSGVRRQRKDKKRPVSGKFNMDNLAEMMLERLKGLQEDELASLATIVATSGLSAALAKEEIVKKHDLDCTAGGNQLRIPAPRRTSTSGAGMARNLGMDAQRQIMDETELPSLDKFLVKKLTRLEREVLEAKNARNNEAKEDNKKRIPEAKNNSGELVHEEEHNNNSLNHNLPGLGDVLVKHSSKLEKEIEKARKNQTCSTTRNKKLEKEVCELPSLDKFLVKHVSRLEKEVQEAKNRRNFEQCAEVTDSRKATSLSPDVEKENINLNPNVDSDLDLNKKEQSLKKKTAEGSVYDDDIGSDGRKDAGKSLNNDGMQASSTTRRSNQDAAGFESLDKILVKHVSRLEREKMEFQAGEGAAAATMVRRETRKALEKKGCGEEEESLEQVLVKHKSRLEREKMAAASPAAQTQTSSSEVHQVMHSVARREARQKELQEAWGGLSLGNSMRPHLSRLQRDKAAWLKAEEEEKKRAMY